MIAYDPETLRPIPVSVPVDVDVARAVRETYLRAMSGQDAPSVTREALRALRVAHGAAYEPARVAAIASLEKVH